MPTSNARILIVEDEPQVRELLLDALQEEGLDVRAAASGAQAIELLRSWSVDFVVTDLLLGDCTGLDVLDAVRKEDEGVPAVIVTGHGDPQALSEASRRRPVELMIKPLDVERLRCTIRRELSRRRDDGRWQRRAKRLRRLARTINLDRRIVRQKLQATCTQLTNAYRDLCGEMAVQKTVLDYHGALISARNDDDVFRALFRLIVQRSGPVFGAALATDASAELKIVGRFGVPQPDSLTFCERLIAPIVERLLACPQCVHLDATDHLEIFDESIRRYLVGVSILGLPLCPAEGELIGATVLYRKGEQPFTEEDVALAEAVAPPTALAVQRND